MHTIRKLKKENGYQNRKKLQRKKIQNSRVLEDKR